MKKEDKVKEKISEEEKKEQKEDICETLKAQIAELNDKMVRLQADTDNYRKRMLREKEDAVRFANESLISDILVFLDNLDRALALGKTSDVSALVSGLEMAQSELYSLLDKNWGLKVIDTKDKEFDPEKHEACMMEVHEELKAEVVLDEFQKGYTLHDRVLRPAKVKIGKPC